MSKIDQKLEQVIGYVRSFQRQKGYPPSVREICVALGIKSTATAQYYLDKLEDRGVIMRKGGKNRTIALSDTPEFVSVPLVGTVTAGTPILAVENLEGYYPLPPEFADGGTCFLLRVKGESMIEAGILDGDKIVCRKCETADNGDIVVALLDDSATVKRFYRKDGKVILHPENSTMSDIVCDSDVSILAKVTGLLRKYH